MAGIIGNMTAQAELTNGSWMDKYQGVPYDWDNNQLVIQLEQRMSQLKYKNLLESVTVNGIFSGGIYYPRFQLKYLYSTCGVYIDLS